jgi:hypothetical protein
MNRLYFFLMWVAMTNLSCNWLQSESDLFAVQVGDKWGYINTSGEMVIAAQFKMATPFFEGRALCRDAGDMWGFIDETGKFVISPSFSDAGRFSEGLAPVVKENGKVVFIDKEGEVQMEPQRVNSSFGFREGLARAEFNGKWGFLDKDGEWAIPPVYHAAQDFHEGLAAVGRYDSQEETMTWGYVNRSGGIQIPFQFNMGGGTYPSPGDFHDGMAFISNDGETWGFINTQGNFEISPQFDYSDSFFKEGLSGVEKSEKVGFINAQGTYEVNLQFTEVLPFSSNGMAAVQTDDEKWGFIGEDGRIVINPQFESIGNGYFGNVALVQSSGKYGLIDEEGKYLANPQFDDVFTPNPEYNWSVTTDFIPAEDMAAIVFHQSGGTYFQGMNASTTLGDVEMREGGLDVSSFSESSFREEDTFHEWNSVMDVQGMSYFFDGNIYEREAIYREVERWSWLFGSYTDYDLVGYERNIKRERALSGSYVSWNTVSTKTEEATNVAKALLELAKVRYGGQKLFEQEIENNSERGCHLLRSSEGLVVITYAKNDEEEQGTSPHILEFAVGFFNANLWPDLDELAANVAEDYF